MGCDAGAARGTPAAGADLFTFVTAKFGGEGSRPLTTYLRALGLLPTQRDRDADERAKDRHRDRRE